MVCNQTLSVLLFQFNNLGIGFRQFLLLATWHLDIADGDGHTKLGCIRETKPFDLIGQLGRPDTTIGLEAFGDNLPQILFLHGVVLEAQPFWQSFIEDDTPDGCLDSLPVGMHARLLGRRVVVHINIAHAHFDECL